MQTQPRRLPSKPALGLSFVDHQLGDRAAGVLVDPHPGLGLLSIGEVLDVAAAAIHWLIGDFVLLGQMGTTSSVSGSGPKSSYLGFQGTSEQEKIEVRHEPDYQRLLCDWCEAQATKSMTVGPGRRAGYCDDCGDRAHRFQASFDPKLSQSSILIGTAWLPSEDKPDLVIHRPNKPPITIRDHRQLNAKAMKELLPPVKLPRKRKAATPKTAPDRAKDIARRRRQLDRDLRQLLKEPEGLSVSEIAEAVGIPSQQLEEMAA